MPTIVDSLIIELGLDANNLNRESRKALESMAKLGKLEDIREAKAREAADKAAGRPTIVAGAYEAAEKKKQLASQETARKQTQSTHEVVKSETEAVKRRAEGFNQIKEAALSFGAALSIVGVEKFIQNTASGVAETGRLAYNLDMSTTKVSAWGRAVEQSVGGNAKAATGTLIGLTQALVKMKTQGDRSLIPLVSQLEVMGHRQFNMNGPDGKPLDAQGFMREISEYASRMDPATFSTILSPYLDPDSINFEALGPKGQDAALAKQREIGVPNDAEATADAKLIAATQELEQRFKRLGELIVFRIAPDLTRFIQDFLSFGKLISRKISFSDFQKERAEHWREELVDYYTGKGLSPANAGVAADNSVKYGIDPTSDDQKLAKHADPTPGVVDSVKKWLGMPTAGQPAQLPGDIEAEVRKDAKTRGVDPELAVALFRTEGGGYNKVSPAGAFGPAQLMPDTADLLGVANGPNAPGYDWHTNTDAGVRLIAGLLKRFHGNTDAAAAAYNAGPGNAGVLKFAATGDPSGLPDQTKNYLASIHAITQAGSNAPQVASGGKGTSTNSSEVHIGTQIINGVDPSSAHTIASGMHGAIASHPLVVQSNTGLE